MVHCDHTWGMQGLLRMLRSFENTCVLMSTLCNALCSPLIMICLVFYFTATLSIPVGPLPALLPSSERPLATFPCHHTKPLCFQLHTPPPIHCILFLTFPAARNHAGAWLADKCSCPTVGRKMDSSQEEKVTIELFGEKEGRKGLNWMAHTFEHSTHPVSHHQ